MQIDLLLSSEGEVGLLSNTDFETSPSGAIYDGKTHSLTLEFSESFDSLEMNVPISFDIGQYIKELNWLYLGVMENGKITKAGALPLMHINLFDDE